MGDSPPNQSLKPRNWLSTHPNSQDRASEIFKLRKLEQYRTIPFVTAGMWKKFKSELSDVAGEKK